MLIAQKAHMTSVLPEARAIDLPAAEQGYRAALVLEDQGEELHHYLRLDFRYGRLPPGRSRAR